MVAHDQRSAQSGDFREDIIKAMNRISESGVTIKNGADIENHLLDHPAIYRVLPDIVDDAFEQLRGGSQVVLELDCSSGPGNEYLVLLLRSQSYDAGILELGRDLTARARSRMETSEHRFIVTTDFAVVP